LEQFCAEHRLPFERCGKLVLAREPGELRALDELQRRGEQNGLQRLERLDPRGIAEREPHARGIAALWVGDTGIVDFGGVAAALADEIRAGGGRIELETSVRAAHADGPNLRVMTNRSTHRCRFLIGCAGLQADRLARACGLEPRVRILPFRGDYHELVAERRHLVNHLIYPVPDPRFPFLGVHLTRRMDGEVLAGPNAVLATAREGYRRRDISARDLAEVLTYPGFIRLARRFWRTGMAEMWRDWSKRAYVAEVRRYVPALSAEHMTFGPSGVRAQALRRDGSLVDDFLLGGTDRVLHVFNAPSPAATSSLAIGRTLAAEAIGRFAL
jgi:L-2-hydroxyglutarate oxidase LhgO